MKRTKKTKQPECTREHVEAWTPPKPTRRDRQDLRFRVRRCFAELRELAADAQRAGFTSKQLTSLIMGELGNFV
jgi:hypothetical protein